MFCAAKANDKTPSIGLLPREHRITTKELAQIPPAERLLLDTRPTGQFAVVSLAGAVSVPIDQLASRIEGIREQARDRQCIVICRRGNDSQLAVQMLHQAGLPQAKDVIGGMSQYARDVDPTLPIL